MLSRANRLTSGTDYRYTVRRGRRCVAAHTVTHVVSREGDDVRFGFIVSKAVGNAVVRNTVRRRLKAACHQLMASVQPGHDIVIRALPSSADAAYRDVLGDIERCLRRVVR